MKGNKKLLVLAALVLLLTVVFSTYAIYRSSASGTGTVQAAAWQVQIHGTDMDSVTQIITANDFNCTSTASKVNGKIAPDSTCTVTIPVDATGSEVDVLLEASIGSTSGLPDGVTVALASGSASQTIQYNASSMTADVVINVNWSGALSDDATKDSSDKTAAGNSISIPVTLTARQKLANGD